MSDEVDRTVLPIRRPPFTGVADKTLGGSQPDWGLIGHVKPPAGAPNVLLVLIDDAGFGNPATFGGPIATPNYDRMALVTNDADGNVTLKETGDHLGRKGMKIGGGVGLVVGLFAPPLLASAVVGGGAKKLKAALAEAQAGWHLDQRADRLNPDTHLARRR